MNGFLDTEGKFHECEPWGHLDKAWEIVVEEMKVPVANRLKAEEHLQKLGWVVVRTSDVYGLIGYCKSEDSDERYSLTEKQKDWLLNAYEDMTPNCRVSVDIMLGHDNPDSYRCSCPAKTDDCSNCISCVVKI